MKKLTLELDGLRVASFETGARGEDGRGTVWGHARVGDLAPKSTPYSLRASCDTCDPMQCNSVGGMLTTCGPDCNTSA